jgi:hypothetical protein
VRRQIITLIFLTIAAHVWAAPNTAWPGTGEVYYSAEAEVMCAVWKENVAVELGRQEKAIAFSVSQDRGRTWAKPDLIIISGESPTSLEAVIDHFKSPTLIFISENKDLKRQRLYFTSLASVEPRVIFESQDAISAPRLTSYPELMVASWETRYLERATAYLAVSLDQGRHFGAARPSATAGLPLPPAAPTLNWPSDGSVTRLVSPEISYRIDSADPMIARVDISFDKAFRPDKTWSFNNLTLPGSSESRFQLPVELPDGKYYLRLAAFDGLAESAARTVSFTVDTRPPVITLLTPTGEADQATIIISGEVDEPSALTLNGQPLITEARGRFSRELPLLAGNNIITLIATDAAGNTGRAAATILFDLAAPHLKILKPKATDWFKPGSTIFVEADVSDAQNDIEDESEGIVSLEGKSLTDRPAYDASAAKLSGFITLPSDLPDGKYQAKLSLRDLAGNLAVKPFTIAVDNSPPRLTISRGEMARSSSPTLLPMPVDDAGSGLDISGTLISINGVSLNVLLSGEAQELFAAAIMPLADGTYEVSVLPRDKVGNTGARSVFNLVVDTRPPQPGALSSQGRLFSIISSFSAGPNPFSPRNDGNMYFIYNFSSAADRLKIYIFDLAGTLVWQKELTNVTADSLAWNGVDHFGRTAANGVYSYLMAATAGGQMEIRRGKLIILQ